MFWQHSIKQPKHPEILQVVEELVMDSAFLRMDFPWSEKQIVMRVWKMVTVVRRVL